MRRAYAIESRFSRGTTCDALPKGEVLAFDSKKERDAFIYCNDDQGHGVFVYGINGKIARKMMLFDMEQGGCETLRRLTTEELIGRYMERHGNEA